MCHGDHSHANIAIGLKPEVTAAFLRMSHTRCFSWFKVLVFTEYFLNMKIAAFENYTMAFNFVFLHPCTEYNFAKIPNSALLTSQTRTWTFCTNAGYSH